MKRLKIIGGNLDFVTLQEAGPGDHPRGCYYRADEVEALLRDLIATAGHPDAAEACRLVIAECRKQMEVRP